MKIGRSMAREVGRQMNVQVHEAEMGKFLQITMNQDEIKKVVSIQNRRISGD